MCAWFSDSKVSPTPWAKEVKISMNETQLFKCEAKQNVTLTFSDDPQGVKRNVSYQFEKDNTFPFIASYTTKIKEFSNFTLVNCTTIPSSNGSDAYLLHVWEFYPEGIQNYSPVSAGYFVIL